MIKHLLKFFLRSNTRSNSEVQLTNKKNGYGTKELDPSEEYRWKTKIFDTTMDPREWMARHGHNILVGDFRIYKFKDKEFEKWIHEAFGALTSEGLEKLWKEFLTDDEILKVRDKYNNP